MLPYGVVHVCNKDTLDFGDENAVQKAACEFKSSMIINAAASLQALILIRAKIGIMSKSNSFLKYISEGE